MISPVFCNTWTACSKAQEIPSNSCTCLIAYGIERFVSIRWIRGRHKSMTILQASPLCLTASFSRTTSTANSPCWFLLELLIQVIVSGLLQIILAEETLWSPRNYKFTMSFHSAISAQNNLFSMSQWRGPQ